MRTSKKILAMLLVLLMVASLGATALASGGDPAAETYSITMKNAQPGTYKVALIFSATGTDGDDADSLWDHNTVQYPRVSSAWVDFFTNGAGADYLRTSQLPDTDPNYPLYEVMLGTEKMYIEITESNVVEFAEAAKAYASTLTGGVGERTYSGAPGGDFTFNVSTPGYILVWCPDHDATNPDGNGNMPATMVMLDTTHPTVEIQGKSKGSVPVKEPADVTQLSTFAESGAKVGEVLWYQIRFTIPDTTGSQVYEMKFVDTLSEGLSMLSAQTSIPNGFFILDVNGARLARNSTVIGSITISNYSESGFTAVVDATQLQAFKGREAIITYNVRVNENANNHKNVNNEVTYERNKDGDVITVPAMRVYTWTNTINIDKYDAGDNAAKLDGAKFILVRKGVKYAVSKGAADNVMASALNNGTFQYSIGANDVFPIVGDGLAMVAGANAGEPVYRIEAPNHSDIRYVKASAVTVVTNDENTEFYYYRTGAGHVRWTTDASIATEVTTADGGKGSFAGVADGTYYLRETQAPEGYRLRPDVQVVVAHGSETVGEGDNVVNVPVRYNDTVGVPNSGGILPGTGGVGTTIFYILGSCMLLGAAVLLITRRRMKSES